MSKWKLPDATCPSGDDPFEASDAYWDTIIAERNEALDLLERWARPQGIGYHPMMETEALLDRLREAETCTTCGQVIQNNAHVCAGKSDDAIEFTFGHYPTEVARVNADNSRGFYVDDKNKWAIYTQDGRVLARGEGDKVLQVGNDPKPKKQKVREKIADARKRYSALERDDWTIIGILADAIDRLEAER